jgi:hypothetical protein
MPHNMAETVLVEYNFHLYHLKDSKNQQYSFTSSRIWELSFILFFVSLHRVTQI